uniref:WAP four-disulfide core domain 3 n=1 Tax=Rousettus aegyptiacus TaxID=9407 RepID=A0A7J8DM83_ROUAE|nr:WAP four-disulfide core domain 3 [Rousettus aegyptiacus]
MRTVRPGKSAASRAAAASASRPFGHPTWPRAPTGPAGLILNEVLPLRAPHNKLLSLATPPINGVTTKKKMKSPRRNPSSAGFMVQQAAALQRSPCQTLELTALAGLMSAQALLPLLLLCALLLQAHGGYHKKEKSVEVCEKRPSTNVCHNHCSFFQKCTKSDTICCSTYCGNVCMSLLSQNSLFTKRKTNPREVKRLAQDQRE